ncbi:hypothetical protein AGMMS50256_37190 [Betaproteobacteria bacterium]|nr:hypothetical protein AGMMS50256_37190 [Betaproteobacteria bacterium]
MTTNQPVLLKDAAKQDAEITRFSEQIKSGALHVESPGMDPLPPWTEEERQDLYRVIHREVTKIGK